MLVRVRVAGIYNGPGHRALPWAEVGELIDVADAKYADRLMGLGMVEAPEGPGSGVGDQGAGGSGQEAEGELETKRKPSRRQR